MGGVSLRQEFHILELGIDLFCEVGILQYQTIIIV